MKSQCKQEQTKQWPEILSRNMINNGTVINNIKGLQYILENLEHHIQLQGGTYLYNMHILKNDTRKQGLKV